MLDPYVVILQGAVESNLPAGTIVRAGIYVVTHRGSAHTLPHEVAIPTAMALPKCGACEDVRFSRKCDLPTPLGENEFFSEHRTAAIPAARIKAELRPGNATRPQSSGKNRSPASTNKLQPDYVASVLKAHRVCDETYKVLRAALETEVSIFANFALSGGDRTKARAQSLIYSARRLISYLPDQESKDSFDRHLDQIQKAWRLTKALSVAAPSNSANCRVALGGPR